MIRVGVLGGTGYVGQELIRLLYRHPEVELTKIISESNKDKAFAQIYRNHTGFQNIICEGLDDHTIVEGIDVLFSALPYGTLMQHLTREMLEQVMVIDLGVDYRLMDANEYLNYYKKEHKSIELTPYFTYGLCEWNKEEIQEARHIANPGCFATAIQLALMPLIKENIIQDEVIIDGKTSYSASGRTLTIGTHFSEANESTKPYKIIGHPHSLESKKGVAYFTDKNVDLTFVPHMIPMQRGLLITAYTKLNQLSWTDDKGAYGTIRSVYEHYYHDAPFIALLEKGMYVETKWVRNSNMCHINFEIDEENERLIVFAAIDNLMKGAAGQAVQNFNIRFGFPEQMALDEVPICI